jgi:hypothetical protein
VQAVSSANTDQQQQWLSRQAGGSSVEHTTVVKGSSKCQAWPCTNHLGRLLKETCPNHAYLVKHKLRDCNMMKSFMTSGSLSRGMEVNEVPDEGDATPFPGEEALRTICDEHPSPGRRCVTNPSLGTPFCLLLPRSGTERHHHRHPAGFVPSACPSSPHLHGNQASPSPSPPKIGVAAPSPSKRTDGFESAQATAGHFITSAASSSHSPSYKRG